MRFGFIGTLKSTAFVSAMALASLVASPSGAAAHYTTTRCDRDGDRCWVVRCDDDGDDCYHARTFIRDDYDRRHSRPRGYWACDQDGDDCHWVHRSYYDRYYYDYGRPDVGITFGWHN